MRMEVRRVMRRRNIPRIIQSRIVKESLREEFSVRDRCLKLSSLDIKMLPLILVCYMNEFLIGFHLLFFLSKCVSLLSSVF